MLYLESRQLTHLFPYRELRLSWTESAEAISRVHPFITPNAASNASFSTPHLHAKLDTFPALLPSTPFLSADILHLAPPSGSTSHSLLTGTFPLSSSQIHSPVLDFAETASRLSLLLDVLLRGLETAEHSFTDGEKQTMIWREELETCAEQQGSKHVPQTYLPLLTFGASAQS